MRIVCDMDVLAYTCGFASQRTSYDYSVVTPEGDVIEEGVVQLKDELEAISLMRPPGTDFHVDERIDAEPLVNALAMCKRTLLNIEAAMEAEKFDFDRLELFLTGNGNFRNDIATIKGYKANRIGLEKPIHYKAIRRYMRERWHATTVHGYEADDAVAMVAASCDYDPTRCVIVSMDKDLKTVPGALYNFKRKKLVTITPNEALVNFYRQCLTGDVVDNIGGCFKCGEKGALELIQPGMSEWEMYCATLAEYEKSLGRKGCPYVSLGAAAALLENATLLHMQRYVGERWAPPTDPALRPKLLPALRPSVSPSPTKSTDSNSLSEKLAASAELAESPSTSCDAPATNPTSSSPASPTSKPKANLRPRTGSVLRRSKQPTPESGSSSSSSATTG